MIQEKNDPTLALIGATRSDIRRLAAPYMPPPKPKHKVHKASVNSRARSQAEREMRKAHGYTLDDKVSYIFKKHDPVAWRKAVFNRSREILREKYGIV